MTAEHRFASSRLFDYRDHALPDAEQRRVGEHLCGCADCRESLVLLTVLAQQLRDARSPAPEGLADRVIAHLDTAPTTGRLSVVTTRGDSGAPRVARVAAARGFMRAHLRRTLAFTFAIGLAVTLVKDLGTVLDEGFTLQTCAVCGANFVAAFVALNIGLLIALRSNRARHPGRWTRP